MKKNYLHYFLLAIFFSIGIGTYAQAPANDDCSGAIMVGIATDEASCIVNNSTSTLNASTATYTSACWSTSYDDDIWYSFVATTAQTKIVFSNLSASAGTIGYTVFEGSCTAAEFFCTGAAAGVATTMNNLTVGQTYYISMFYFGTTNRGTFDFCLYNALPPPPNDNCSGAIAIPVSIFPACTNTTANTMDASTATYVSNCWSTSYDDDVWYSFTATNTSLFLTVSNLSVSTGSIGYALFETDCANAEFACNIYTADPADTLTGLTIGNTYYLSMFYAGTTDRGSFDVCVADTALSIGIKPLVDIENSLHVFPNPTSDNLVVKFQTNKVNQLTLALTDSQGKEVYTSSEKFFSGDYTKTIDLKTFSKGIYFLKLTSDNSTINQKIVLQ